MPKRNKITISNHRNAGGENLIHKQTLFYANWVNLLKLQINLSTQRSFKFIQCIKF